MHCVDFCDLGSAPLQYSMRTYSDLNVIGRDTLWSGSPGHRTLLALSTTHNVVIKTTTLGSGKVFLSKRDSCQDTFKSHVLYSECEHGVLGVMETFGEWAHTYWS